MQLTQVQCKVAYGSLLAQNLYSHVVVLYLHTRRSRSDMRVGKYTGAQLQVTTSNAIRKFGPKNGTKPENVVAPKSSGSAISKGGY